MREYHYGCKSVVPACARVNFIPHFVLSVSNASTRGAHTTSSTLRGGYAVMKKVLAVFSATRSLAMRSPSVWALQLDDGDSGVVVKRPAAQ